MMKKITTRYLAYLALFIVMDIIATRFLAINTQFTRISLGFIPLLVAGWFFGVRFSVLMAVVADIVRALLFPTGPYYFGFTLTALVNGLLVGLMYQTAQPSRRVLWVIPLQAVASYILNSIWLIHLYGESTIYQLPLRAGSSLITCLINMLLGYLIIQALEKRHVIQRFKQ